MKILRIFGVVLITLLVSRTIAQTALPTCARQPVMDALAEAVLAVRGREDVTTELEAAQHAIGTYLAACDGLAWSGQGAWIGDLTTFPDGLYVMHFEVDGDLPEFVNIRAGFEPLNDNEPLVNCGVGMLYGFDIGRLTQLHSCRGFVKIDMDGDYPWRLWLEKLPLSW